MAQQLSHGLRARNLALILLMRGQAVAQAFDLDRSAEEASEEDDAFCRGDWGNSVAVFGSGEG